MSFNLIDQFALRRLFVLLACIFLSSHLIFSLICRLLFDLGIFIRTFVFYFAFIILRLTFALGLFYPAMRAAQDPARGRVGPLQGRPERQRQAGRDAPGEEHAWAAVPTRQVRSRVGCKRRGGGAVRISEIR